MENHRTPEGHAHTRRLARNGGLDLRSRAVSYACVLRMRRIRRALLLCKHRHGDGLAIVRGSWRFLLEEAFNACDDIPLVMIILLEVEVQ